MIVLNISNIFSAKYDHHSLQLTLHILAITGKYRKRLTKSKNWRKIVDKFHDHQGVSKCFSWQTNSGNSIKLWQWLKTH